MTERPYLPREDLAIIGAWVIGLSAAETAEQTDRTEQEIVRRLYHLRNDGFLLPYKRQTPPASRQYPIAADGYRAATIPLKSIGHRHRLEGAIEGDARRQQRIKDMIAMFAGGEKLRVPRSADAFMAAKIKAAGSTYAE